ncbi:MAG: SapC family protein [Gammaproteobacteria bacterium]|nr:SapC family protein [Gammaproteobacteria bacterium]
MRSGELGLAYLHLHSLRHIKVMAADLGVQAGTEKATGKATAEVADDAPASALVGEVETGPESGRKTH